MSRFFQYLFIVQFCFYFMKRTSPLRKVKEILEQKEIDFKLLSLWYRKHKRYDPTRSFNFNEYERAFKDNLVKSCLDEIQEEENGLHFKSLLVKSDKYFSKYDDLGRVKVYEKRKKRHPIAVYENLFLVNRTPCVIESCIARFIPLKRMKVEIQIMEELFGYIILSPKEYLISMRAKKFETAGGLIARFSLSRENFRQGLKKALREYNFPVRD